MEPKTRKEILIKLHDEYLERLLRNEIDVIYFKSEDKFVNTADAKKSARDARDRAIEAVRGTKRTIEITKELLEKGE